MAKRDNAPIGNTCPIIDEAISHIDSILSFVNEDEITDGKYHADNATSYLEDIRSANSTLRDWGNDMSDQRDELEEENNDLENLLTEARDEITRLKEEIDGLNYDITQLEIELQSKFGT